MRSEMPGFGLLECSALRVKALRWRIVILVELLAGLAFFLHWWVVHVRGRDSMSLTEACAFLLVVGLYPAVNAAAWWTWRCPRCQRRWTPFYCMAAQLLFMSVPPACPGCGAEQGEGPG
jgi:hypothetical protein